MVVPEVAVAFLLAGMMGFAEVIAADSVGLKLLMFMLVREGAMEEDLLM